MNKMEYHPSLWLESKLNNQSNVIYTISEFTTSNMLISNLCDFGDADIFVKETLLSTADNAVIMLCR